MFKIKNGKIFKQNKPFTIRGINLGGWLNREGYILGGRNLPEHQILNKVEKTAGGKWKEKFIEIIEKNFITETDFKNIKKLGLNTVRIPFNAKLFLTPDGKFNSKRINSLKKAVALAKKHKIYSILDMHAAPGSQNADWHSDSSGKAKLWQNKIYQEETIRIWEKLSKIFRDEPFVIGYDLLNEPNWEDTRKIFKLYENAILEIRKNKDNKIIFLEGSYWSQRIEFLAPFARLFENICISIHFYEPVSFTFNMVTGQKYPGKIDGKNWNIKTIEKTLEKYKKFEKKYNTPIFVGEFGISSRCPYCHSEFNYIEDVLKIFNKNKWHWTYWTYKAVAGTNYPDGLYQLNKNPFWLQRIHHIKSWENFPEIAKRNKKNEIKELIETLQTKSFDINITLAKILKKFAKNA